MLEPFWQETSVAEIAARARRRAEEIRDMMEAGSATSGEGRSEYGFASGLFNLKSRHRQGGRGSLTQGVPHTGFNHFTWVRQGVDQDWLRIA